MRVYYWQECINCGNKIKPDNFHYTCPKCGSLLLVKRDEEWIDRYVGKGKKAQQFFNNIRYGKDRKKYPNDSGVFMWLDHILPGFPVSEIVSLREGFTDLFEIPDWLKKEIGLKKLFIKMEGQLPSESFKDRGMSTAISETLRIQKFYPNLGIHFVACASTGDTSASAAIYSAYVKDRLKCIVFLPHKKVSNEQLFQVIAHGAMILSLKHEKGFDGCMKLIQEYCKAHPEIVLLNSKNSFRLVGQETIALEICHDLNWQVPDWISVPAGNGGNLTSLMISLLRMKERGLINKLPKIIVAQTKSANTLVRWAESKFVEYEPCKFKDTIATGMNIQDPVSFPRIEKLYKNFEIKFFDVSEEKIQKTRALFMKAGANICPQTAVALDAVLQARENKVIKENDTIVAVSTASGVKFTKGNFSNAPHVIEGTIESIEKELQK